jgi:glycosyltransferase 2 family protein
MSGWNRRHVALVAAKVLLSLGLMAVLLWRIRFDTLAETLRGADTSWLALALLAMFASNLLGSYQWSRLLQIVNIRIPYWKVSAYYHIGLFFNNFLPANVGGDIARIADSSRYAPSTSAAVSAVLMDRMVGTLALAGMAMVTTIPVATRFHLVLVYLALVGFFLLSVGLLFAAFHPAVIPALSRLLDRLGLVALSPHVSALAERLGTFRGKPGLLARIMAVAVLTQISRIGVHALVARSLGIDLPFSYFLLFVPLLAVIVSLPISVNGIGVREGAGVVLFGLVAVDRAHAFSLQFATYLVAVAVSLLGGLVFLLRIPRRRAESRKLVEETE